jgi:ATP-dependent protease ClpP protease subunit
MSDIQIVGEINDDAYKAFSDQLREFQKEYPKAKLIDIEINSFGGSAISALAIASKIRTCGLRVRITAFGEVASAAVIILAYGHERSMAKEAWVMVHEDAGKIKGNVVELEREASHMRRLEEQWCDLLADCTNTTAALWSDMHKKTTYFNARQCLTLGLIDKVI